MKSEKQQRSINRKKQQIEFINFAKRQKLNFIRLQIGLQQLKNYKG